MYIDHICQPRAMHPYDSFLQFLKTVSCDRRDPDASYAISPV